MEVFRWLEWSPGFLIGAAAALLILPLRWLIASAIAAGFHELCHLLLLRLCGSQAQRVRFGPGGAVIQAPPLPPARAMLCSLAGPAGGLMLLSLSRWFPRLALCAAIQSAYNLLPVSGLDGGHALRFFTELFLPSDAAGVVCRIVQGVILLLVGFLGFYGTFILRLGVLPILAAGSLVIKATNGKIPCKTGPMGVQ